MSVRLLVACFLAFFVGCGKQRISSTSPAEPTENSAAASTNPAAAPTDSSAAAASQAQMATVLGELTQAVRKYSVEQRRVPKTFDELVAAGYLTRLPQAPAGKQFAINKNLQVYLSDR